MDEKVKEYMDTIPKSYQANYSKAMSGKSRSAGVKGKCLDCFNYQRTELQGCSITTCPLYPYRPYKTGKKAPMVDVLAEENE